MFVGEATQAKQRLNELNINPEWKSALFDKKHPQHEAVIKERMELNKIAFPDIVE